MELNLLNAILAYGLMGLILGIIYGWFRKRDERYPFTRAAFFLGCGSLTGAVLSSRLLDDQNFPQRIVGILAAIPIMLVAAKVTWQIKNRKHQSHASVLE